MADELIAELEKVISSKKSFIFTAGAGSGKTYSLIQSLVYTNKLYGESLSVKNQKIACITYTNAGVDEINSRLPNLYNLKVCTIHEFLWSIVKNFQKDLNTELKNYFKEKADDLKKKSERARKPEKAEEYILRYVKFKELYNTYDENTNNVCYQDKSNYRKKIISHDVLIKLSMKVLQQRNDYLSLISGMYPIILVDEYQDTFKEITDLFKELSEFSQVGFYGDPMQKIYDRGVGSIENNGEFVDIYSEINRRSSKKIVDLINHLRTDKIRQKTVKDEDGSVTFIHSEIVDVDVFDYLGIEKSNYVEMQLLHRRIAERLGFLNLFNLVNDQYGADVFINNSDNRYISAIIDMLFEFEKSFMEPYRQGKNIVLKKNYRSYSIEPIDFDKLSKISSTLDFLSYCQYIHDNYIREYEVENYETSFEEEIIIFKEKTTNKSISLNEYYNWLDSMKQEKIVTCHSTKGKEYKNIVVYLTEGDWERKYKWSSYFQDEKLTPSQFISTSNLFYVVCSRAIENLIIVYTDSDGLLKDRSNLDAWFGEENVIHIT